MVGNDYKENYNDIERRWIKRMMIYVQFDLSCIPIEDAMDSE